MKWASERATDVWRTVCRLDRGAPSRQDVPVVGWRWLGLCYFWLAAPSTGPPPIAGRSPASPTIWVLYAGRRAPWALGPWVPAWVAQPLTPQLHLATTELAETTTRPGHASAAKTFQPTVRGSEAGRAGPNAPAKALPFAEPGRQVAGMPGSVIEFRHVHRSDVSRACAPGSSPAAHRAIPASPSPAHTLTVRPRGSFCQSRSCSRT
ncbi:hypothetical protein BDY21DRAFT_124200 [Lineolata rhizophorae]|uniref:Uncharacterized protein n=1 Tax=Lineolata rhizophorae TaxID=578093 RepID=A0A6A6NNX0_9PEZI|nr:hypothetical protein BDY21DRAFT_124200 [Lineolata rhizophorae]